MIALDLNRRVLVRGGDVLHLTRSEFELVALLIAHPEFVRSRDQLMDAMKGVGSREGYITCVDVHVKRLRRKLMEAWGPEARACIRTAYGFGYSWKEGA